METRYDIVAIGELLVDMTPYGSSNDKRPLFEANAGGAPCNVVVMAQRLGSRCAFIGKVGHDAFGDMLISTVRDLGIDASGVCRAEKIPTTLALIALDENNERSFSFYRNPGADSMLNAADVSEEQVAAGSILHFGAMSLMGGESRAAVISAMDTAKKHGRMLSFDPNIREFLLADEERLRDTLEYGFSNCNILKLSDDELLYCTGIKDPNKAADALINAHPNIGVFFLTMGARGCLVVNGGEHITVPGFLQPRVVDTTGAGDAFYGVCLSSLAGMRLSELDAAYLRETALKANAAGAIITGRRGALLSMPSAGDIAKMIGRA